VLHGKIENLIEKEISWTDSMGYSHGPFYISAFTVSDGRALYGEFSGGANTIRILDNASTREPCKQCVPLIEGQEYYFILHIFTGEERQALPTDRDALMLPSLGDAIVAGSHYAIFPVVNGKVQYRTESWPFRRTGITEAKELLPGLEVTIMYTLEPESFEAQLCDLIRQEKKEP
jgi:hypothetical protein